MKKKKLLGFSLILCLLISVSFIYQSFYAKKICSLWDVSNNKCYACNYDKPVFIGKKAINHCSKRILKENCCKSGFYSIPNDYQDIGKQFDCDYFWSKNIYDACGYGNKKQITLRNVCSIIMVLTIGLLLILLFLLIFKKIRKKCLLLLKIDLSVLICATMLIPISQWIEGYKLRNSSLAILCIGFTLLLLLSYNIINGWKRQK